MNEQPLKDKIAMITGGSKGIGKSIAISMAKQGADVIIAARDEKKMIAVVNEIKELGRRARYIRVDVTKRADIDHVMNNVVPEFGGIDIFVNNAGVTAFNSIIDSTPEDIDKLIDTNLKGAVYFLQGAARQMISQKRGGNIIIITSINAIRPLPCQAIYSCTKSALETIMKCLASDLAAYGIRVNSVAPGAIATDMNEHFTDEVMKEVSEYIPLGRIGNSDEVAELACFLVSKSAAYMTGTTIIADGGYLLRTK